jgi:hypothetical protein
LGHQTLGFLGNVTGVSNDINCAETGDWTQCAQGILNGGLTVLTVVSLGSASEVEVGVALLQ